MQTDMWGRYRITEASEFYDAAGAWSVAQDPGNSIGQTAVESVIDAAGNRQRLQISTDLNAPEATIGEQLKTPGSLENLVAIAIIAVLLYVLQMMKVRKPENGNPWDSLNSTEVIEADSLFEDDVVV